MVASLRVNKWHYIQAKYDNLEEIQEFLRDNLNKYVCSRAKVKVDYNPGGIKTHYDLWSENEQNLGRLTEGNYLIIPHDLKLGPGWAGLTKNLTIVREKVFDEIFEENDYE